MKLDSKKIIDILARENYVEQEDLDKAKEYIKTHNVLITDYLLGEGIITKDLLGQAISESLEVVYADLNTHEPSKKQVLKIPEKLARKLRVVLFAEDKKSITITSDDPKQVGLETKLQEIFPKQKIKITFSVSDDIDNAFSHYRKSLATRFAKIIEGKERIAPEILDEIINDGLTHKASDIHFEPDEDTVTIRFRIDGVLHEAGVMPKEHYENILNRIKVQARMRIDEHNSAQDGSVRHQINDTEKVDLRISIVPTLDGEKIVIRILAEYVKNLNFSNLGLSIKHQEILEEEARKPFGMILVTGPTGSGKTTTLYALLKLLNKPEVNITTIEDPVEYKIPGINQIQINNQTNLSFAKGLRSIVRQDPDIILVGEIRDEETAEISVNAALTGHLLLSTFHSNDAATAIPRLLDMEVEPFLLASTLELVIAQRLARRICEHCRVSINKEDKVIKKLIKNIDPKLADKISTLYKGKGCNICSDTGYSGRTALYEIIKVSAEMQDLILQNPSKQQLWDLAQKQGSVSLFEDGLEKVKSGVTTLEELMRVSPPSK
ncbi:MAG: type II/IV secretion system protein [Candidatus Komeilibacteria bacterium]|nr:type II/IV secretion system protein [Candidatus Komeilibacteria bacterium]